MTIVDQCMWRHHDLKFKSKNWEPGKYREKSTNAHLSEVGSPEQEGGAPWDCAWNWGAPDGDNRVAVTATSHCSAQVWPLTQTLWARVSIDQSEKQQIGKNKNKLLWFLSGLYKYWKCEFKPHTHTFEQAGDVSDGRNQKDFVLAEHLHLHSRALSKTLTCRSLPKESFLFLLTTEITFCRGP